MTYFGRIINLVWNLKIHTLALTSNVLLTRKLVHFRKRCQYLIDMGGKLSRGKEVLNFVEKCIEILYLLQEIQTELPNIRFYECLNKTFEFYEEYLFRSLIRIKNRDI